jgi:phage tail sheath protein FI
VVDNYGSEVTDTVAFRDTLPSTSYAVMDCNWKYQYDKYNDVYRWVPLNGDVAGLCAKTDLERDPWFSPGGLNRGQIRNVIKLAWNPTKTDRDGLYVKGINPIVSFAGEGTVLYGDKTLQSKPSAFDRINVRRLFIVLEKAISRAARFSMFEFNDQFTRAQFVALVEPFLRDVQGRRGITDFRVVCDETNNTGEVIDRNEFVGDIYIKPARSINFIQLNFVAVRTGVAFDEVVGKF